MNKTIQKYFFIMLVAYLLPSIALAQTVLTFTNADLPGKEMHLVWKSMSLAAFSPVLTADSTVFHTDSRRRKSA